MARSIKKGPFIDERLLKAADKMHASDKKTVIKTWMRSATILPQFVGLKFAVYNGKKFIPITVSEDMIGQKLGEYAPTRTYYGHGADKKAKRG
ncbi:30S ribosomal protein S19 [Rickettsiales bacterium LUAb2]